MVFFFIPYHFLGIKHNYKVRKISMQESEKHIQLMKNKILKLEIKITTSIVRTQYNKDKQSSMFYIYLSLQD